MFIDKIVNRGDNFNADIDILKNDRLPIVLYGASFFALDVINYLGRHHVKLDDCFVDEGYFDDPVNRIKNISSFDKINEKYPKFNIVIGQNHVGRAKEKLSKMDCSRVKGIYFFDVVRYDDFKNFNFDYIKNREDKFEKVYESFCDELSKRTYIEYINTKLTTDNKPLYAIYDKIQYFTKDIFELSGEEIFVDAGAYTGDTLEAFLEACGGKFRKYYAFEPEPANAAKLKIMINRRKIENAVVFEKGLWSEKKTLNFSAGDGSCAAVTDSGQMRLDADTIDNLCPDATFIKMDIESAEMEALKGAACVIKNNRPNLAICVYHKPEDLFDIPLYIKSLVPRYKFYLRLHMPAAIELVLYAVREK